MAFSTTTYSQERQIINTIRRRHTASVARKPPRDKGQVLLCSISTTREIPAHPCLIGVGTSLYFSLWADEFLLRRKVHAKSMYLPYR